MITIHHQEIRAIWDFLSGGWKCTSNTEPLTHKISSQFLSLFRFIFNFSLNCDFLQIRLYRLYLFSTSIVVRGRCCPAGLNKRIHLGFLGNSEACSKNNA